MTTIDTIEYKGCTIEVKYDTDSSYCNPRDDDNGTLLSLSHKRYDLPNEAGVPFDDLNSWEEVERWLREHYTVVGLKRVSATDHSGMHYYTGNPRDPWDSGTLGFIIMTAEGQEEVGTPDDLVDELLDGDVEVFGQWANGEVYGYVAEDGAGNEVGSCWGFIGETDDMVEQAKAEVDYHVRRLEAEVDAWAALG